MIINSLVKRSTSINCIVITYNPILVICLACEFLVKISTKFNIYDRECAKIKEQLLILGGKIIENIEDEMIHKIFLDTDFRDRTLLKIITLYDFDSLFASDKLLMLLDEIWHGKESYECDGETSDYSIL